MTKEELEKENAELKNQLRDKKCNDKDCPVFIKLIQANEKNSELRNRNQELLESCEGATMIYKDLCKAKEIIKDLLSLKSTVSAEEVRKRFSVREKAEQFLNE